MRLLRNDNRRCLREESVSRSHRARCFERVLPALVLTTVIIGLGFGVLALSGFTLIRNLGVVTSGLVVLCLLADVTLLPALLVGERRSIGPAAQTR